MNILQLCIRFPPSPGGAETHVYEISKELMKRKHNVTVFTSDLYTETPFKRMKQWEDNVDGILRKKNKGFFPKISGKPLAFREIPVRRFSSHSLGGEAHYVFMPLMIYSTLKEAVDIIHTHSYGYFQTNVAAFAKKIKNIPLVFTPHFHPLWSSWGGKRRKNLRHFYDKMFSCHVSDAADVIICHSKHEVELMNINPEKARVIPAGIDFSLFEPPVDGDIFKKRYNIENELILFSGRLATNKGLHVLVKAIPSVLKNFPKTMFVFVGEDHGVKASLITLAEKLGVEKNVLFTGHIRDEKMFLSAYSACDVFVLPSEYEAFGIVLLEAMASEKACIATGVGGMPEVLDECGVLVNYNDTKHLGDAITNLLDDEKKRKILGKMGRERVEKYFTWEKVVDELEDVYTELLSYS
ncbi:glycosyltransferase family 4 protein [archaeon]|nr:glycosyltransferase family 4 protein [archaeon]